VFARFVVDPPTNTATLTFKQQAATQQQQASSDTEVILTGPELQQLQQLLLLALSGSSTAAAMGSRSSSSSNNGSRSLQLRPLSSAAVAVSSRGSSRARGGAAANGLELVLDGAVAAVLQPAHVMSLVTVFDDLGGQLPQYSLSSHMQKVQVRYTGLQWRKPSDVITRTIDCNQLHDDLFKCDWINRTWATTGCSQPLPPVCLSTQLY
jgi:hypothetical protein